MTYTNALPDLLTAVATGGTCSRTWALRELRAMAEDADRWQGLKSCALEVTLERELIPSCPEKR